MFERPSDRHFTAMTRYHLIQLLDKTLAALKKTGTPAGIPNHIAQPRLKPGTVPLNGLESFLNSFKHMTNA
ncbi:hypothetical protein D3C87_1569390 [compost metagenome]